MKSRQTSIPVDEIFRIVQSWLRENADRFPAMPVCLGISRGMVIYRYTGITRFITVIIDDGGIRVRVLGGAEEYDALVDFDLIPEQDPKGKWYCGMCAYQEVEGKLSRDISKVTRYATFEALFVEHILADWLEWSCNNIHPDHILKICNMDCGTSWATVLKSDESRDAFVEIFGATNYDFSLIRMGMLI